MARSDIFNSVWYTNSTQC